MYISKCCGKEAVRVCEPKSERNEFLASDNQTEANSNTILKRCRTSKKGLKKWFVRHFFFWRKHDKYVLCSTEQKRRLNLNAVSSAEGSEETTRTEDVPVDSTELDEGTTDRSSNSIACDPNLRQDTSQASASRRSTLSSCSDSHESSFNDSDNIVELSEENIEISINTLIENSTTENTSYLLIRELKEQSEFHMGSNIGKGTFGTVRKGKWTLRKTSGEVITRDVAIKVIEHQNPKKLKICTNEMKALTRCNHANIVELHFIRICAQRTFLGIELASRGDLCAYLEENGPIVESQARIWFGQIVDALHHCHRKGIAHLDVKPQNILIVDEMSVKLTDFGLSLVQANPAEITAEQFKTNVACGTLAYAAPENFSDNNKYDSRKCDVWSLGVVLFEMVTNKFPFSICNIEIMVEKISMEELAGKKLTYYLKRVYKRPKFPPGISRPVRGLVINMLKVKPKYRANISKVQHHYWLNFSQ